MTQPDLVQASIECDDHGSCRQAFICRHLRCGYKLGFFEMFDGEEPSTKQGQCFRCGMVSLFIGFIPFIGYRL